eukprot:1085187-Rhodomonas_salina.1
MSLVRCALRWGMVGPGAWNRDMYYTNFEAISHAVCYAPCGTEIANLATFLPPVCVVCVCLCACSCPETEQSV